MRQKTAARSKMIDLSQKPSLEPGECTRLEPGNVVRLCSGGPTMTVAVLRLLERLPAGLNTACTCFWFDVYNVLHQDEFLSCMLEGPVEMRY
jgi:uncharacterized protein YodC (DUF2158 family)